MSILEQIKKLDEQKVKLLADAKKEALANAKKAIAELEALGFHYSLLQEVGTIRRTGIRKEVLNVIKSSKGITRAAILTAMNADEKKTEHSISNALYALKKSGAVTAKDGAYKVAS